MYLDTVIEAWCSKQAMNYADRENKQGPSSYNHVTTNLVRDSRRDATGTQSHEGQATNAALAYEPRGEKPR